MSASRAALPLSVLLAAALAATGCSDENPIEPSPFEQTVSARTIAIVGLATLQQPGDVLQLKATVTFSDGSIRDVTGEAAWHSFGPHVAALSQGGLMTATGYGTTDISVTFQTAYKLAAVRVVPDGMFLVKGRVTEAARFPVPGADVSVTLSDGTVMRTITYANGEFMLPGRGNVTIRASKNWYTVQEKQVTVDADMTVALELQQLDRPDGIQGWWELAFTASPSCTTLPPETRTRTYTARIWEQTRLEVELSGANMEAWGNAGFTGARSGSTVNFVIVDGGLEDYVFVERLDPGRNLGFAGTATGTIGEGSIVATFSGRVQLRTVAFPGQILAECQAEDHRLNFTR